MIIAGERESYAFQRAEELLKEVGFKGEKIKQLVNSCSGGEKQRVALVRAIINNPKVILADEPTGSLDSNNSRVVMEIFKKISKKRLVIMVTHNKDLAYEFSDRVLLMDSNKVKTIDLNKIVEVERYETNNSVKRNSNWINHFVNRNLKKRFKRNLISVISLAISLIFTFVLIGFDSGSKKEVYTQSVQQFDLGVSDISIEKSTDIENSKLKLVKQSRLSPMEISEFISKYNYFEYGLNYDYLVPSTLDISFEGNKLDSLTYNPIYSFKGISCPNFLREGRLPNDTLEEVLINDKAYDYLIKKYGDNPLDLYLSLESKREITTYLDKEDKPYIVDYFNFNKTVKIVGVVKEAQFLNTPKIYYSYKALDDFMSNYLMNNLSAEYGMNYSFKSKIDQASSNDPISSYSHKLFLKNYEDFNYIETIKASNYQITNNSLKIREAVTSFIKAATMGMELFLIIAILGSVFILGITSFSSYTQDEHTNAILLSLGAKRDDIFSIYIIESLALGIASFFISLAISLAISPLINLILTNCIGFNKLVQIPIKSFLNKRFFLPILVFAITSFVSLFSSYIPMSLSKRASLSRRLKEE